MMNNVGIMPVYRMYSKRYRIYKKKKKKDMVRIWFYLYVPIFFGYDIEGFYYIARA